MSDISEQATNFVHDLGEAARRNPLSTALIGMGIAWLFSGRAAGAASEMVRRAGIDRIPDAAGDAFDTAGSVVKSAVGTVGGSLSSAAAKLQNEAGTALQTATQIGRERADMLSDYVQSLPESGSDLMENARDNLRELFRAQPLALGAIGLAIGAGIAAALPATALEAEYLGETSDTVKEKAQEFASEQTARVMDVAEAAVTAATEEASRQGLTVEGVKSAASEMSSKLGRVVDAAGKSVSERAQPGPSRGVGRL